MSRIIRIYDRRPELSGKSLSNLVKTFNKVPEGLTIDEILERYGIASHLTVTEQDGDEGEEKVIQKGRTE